MAHTPEIRAYSIRVAGQLIKIIFAVGRTAKKRVYK